LQLVGRPVALRYACWLDGDADRIVFYSISFLLQMATRLQRRFVPFSEELEKALHTKGTSLQSLRLGVVQTAYANGASTAYLCKVLGNDRVLIPMTRACCLHIRVKSRYWSLTKPWCTPRRYFASTQSCVAWCHLCLLPSPVNKAVDHALLLVNAI
jgi:hypothetical protein